MPFYNRCQEVFSLSFPGFISGRFDHFLMGFSEFHNRIASTFFILPKHDTTRHFWQSNSNLTRPFFSGYFIKVETIGTDPHFRQG
jgi:hypothetical protein